MNYKKGMEIVSVVVPVYNVEHYLPRCLDTIARQTYAALEIILVDDGSTDGSGDICDDFARRDARVKVVHQPNAGLWAARNSGQRASSGDYLLYVDADDYLHLDAIRILHDAINSDNYDLAIMDRKFTERLDEDVECDGSNPLRVYAQDDLMQALFDHERWEIFIYQWNKLYRRSLIEDVWCHDYMQAEDFDFNLQVYLHAGKAVMVERQLYYYVQRTGSLVHRPDAFPIYYRCMTDILYNNYGVMSASQRKRYGGLVLRELYIFMNHRIKCEWGTEQRDAVCRKCRQYERSVRGDFILYCDIGMLEKIGRIVTIRYPVLMDKMRRMTRNKLSFRILGAPVQ